MVFVLRTLSDNALYLYRVSWIYLERCQNFGADTMMKALTDERTLKISEGIPEQLNCTPGIFFSFCPFFF